MHARIRHVVLDRDGVLNAEPRDGGYVTDWSQWQWLPGALESLAMLSSSGLCISVATNQSCVGRGLLARDRLDAVHARMLEEAARAGGIINHLFVCPHSPASGCGCRKPAPGLLRDAAEATGIAPCETIVLGDDLRDLQAASAAGMPAALVRTGKGASTEASIIENEVPVFDDIHEFTIALLSDSIAPVRPRNP